MKESIRPMSKGLDGKELIGELMFVMVTEILESMLQKIVLLL